MQFSRDLPSPAPGQYPIITYFCFLFAFLELALDTSYPREMVRSSPVERGLIDRLRSNLDGGLRTAAERGGFAFS